MDDIPGAKRLTCTCIVLIIAGIAVLIAIFVAAHYLMMCTFSEVC